MMPKIDNVSIQKGLRHKMKKMALSQDQDDNEFLPKTKKFKSDISLKESSDNYEVQAKEIKSEEKVSKTAIKSKSNNIKLTKGKKFFKSSKPQLHRKNDGKTDWTKLKNEKKELKKIRKGKKKKSYFETIQEAKKLWEEVRQGNCPEQRKSELTEQLMNLLSGQISNLMRSHDTTRIIQWIVKLGSEEMKKKIFDDILSDIVTFSRCKYASHTVGCILRHSNPTSRQQWIDIFCKNVMKLLASKFSVPLVEEIYSKFSNKNDKLKFRRAIYSAFHKSGNYEKINGLSDLFSENPGIKNIVLDNMKNIFEKLVEKKIALKSSLLHYVLNDYISHCNENRKQEVFALLQDHIRLLLGSKYGLSVAREIIWNASTKVKKSIVKSLKQDLVSTIKMVYGSNFFMTLIDSVDDTVLMKKSIIFNIVSNVEMIVSDKHGRNVLLYLVAHRDPIFFNPTELVALKQADKYTKKECSVRISELLEGLLDPLICKIEENTQFWLKDGKIMIVAYAILRTAVKEKKDLSKIWHKLSDYIVDENNVFNQGGKEYRIVEHPGLHMILKKIISLFEDVNIKCDFPTILEEKVTSKILSNWVLLNRGCFLLISLIKISSVTESLKQKLSDPGIMKQLSLQSSKGAIILTELANET